MRKLRNNKGVTLTEVLATIVLVGLLGSMISAGIPVITRALDKITTRSRAEMLLNTTVTLLRDNLRYAYEVEKSGDGYLYEGDDGWYYVISKETGTGWILLTPYKSRNVQPENILGIEDASKVKNWHITNDETADKILVATYDSITFADDTDTFTISGLKVYKNTDMSEPIARYVGTDGNPKDLIIRTLNGND